ncbi:hypothetical protein P168DRAFT_133929 [Aspergillus campestris IBT 28561]|uniref:Uncharacterized protein n=1 Tax=Aspergillus campestris (strain IBT 28561) TaxID=1392248 RepID=A0A2I1D833_ASPC2|nr:uncharacterized protein P168DRAFT_133929 [Aspergillus campestris IBT 28561]PKY06034.1 hypothetical protein P168DRAFT_133929 [Aspergillus campestris IBT 28561]
MNPEKSIGRWGSLDLGNRSTSRKSKGKCGVEIARMEGAGKGYKMKVKKKKKKTSVTIHPFIQPQASVNDLSPFSARIGPLHCAGHCKDVPIVLMIFDFCLVSFRLSSSLILPGAGTGSVPSDRTECAVAPTYRRHASRVSNASLVKHLLNLMYHYRVANGLSPLAEVDPDWGCHAVAPSYPCFFPQIVSS